MKPRSSAVPAGMFVAALAAFVLVQTAATVSKDNDTPRAPQGVRVVSTDSAAQTAAWTRVLVELKLPSRHVPEASLKNLTAVLAQRQVIGARRERLLAKLPAGTFRVVHEYLTIPYVALDVTASGAAILADSATDVERVMPDSLEHPALADSAPLVEADQAWAVGYDGSGISIGVVDTGVDATHPFLAGKVQDEACYSSTIPGVSESLCPNDRDEQVGPGAAAPCPYDDCFHGTHVAGIAAGDGARAGQNFSGVAKGADILAVQVFSRIVNPALCGGTAPCVRAFSSDVLAALEHLYIASWDHTIAAVNVSLGSALTSPVCDSQPYKSIIDNLRGVGVATVVASGNGAATGAMASPACVSTAVSVGSTSKGDRLSPFSNVAPSLSLLAPGEAITSALPGGGYGALTGTSMAAAHVAGAFAIAKQAAPSSSVSAILDAFRQTGLPIVDTRAAAGTTVPRLRIFEALARLTHVANPAPAITAISPSGARAGDPAFSLTIDGSGFDVYTVAQWNGSPRPTTVVSANRLSVAIAANDVAAVGTASVRVATPPPGGGTSSSVPFTVAPPATLTPSAARVAPDAGVTVTLANGFGGAADWLALAATDAPDNNFLQQTLVGSGVTNRTWTVTMPTTPGTYEFRLFVNNVRKATSAPVTVDRALTPAPILTDMSPSTVVAGAPAFTIVVQGSHFVPWSLVQWNGTTRPTTYVSATELHADIADADVAGAGTIPVSVVSPAPGGGTSGTLTFTVTNPAPSIGSLTPSGATAGFGPFVLTVNGTGFVATSTVRWNGIARSTTFVSSTVLQAAIAASDVQTAGTASIAVDSPAPGGGTSAALTFTVSNPAPAAMSLLPAGATAGGSSFTLTVNGSGFVGTSTVLWNGVARATTFVSSTQLQAAIASGDIASAGTALVSVASPAPGGGTSSSLAFTVAPPAPVLSVNATTVIGGSPVTVTLTNGLGGSLDWIALADASAPNTSYITYTYVGAGVTSRTWTVAMPATGGPYEFRLFLNNGYTRAATSPHVTVVPPAPTLTVLTPAAVVAGSSSIALTVNGSGFTPASVVLWNGANRTTTYFAPTQLSAAIPASDLVTAGTAQVTVFTPAPGGGTSNALTFTISAPPALTVSATKVAPGGSLSVTLTSGLGGSTDWLAFAPTSAPDSSYLQWVYVGAGVTTKTWTITAPATAGTYEFRLFLNNGYTRAATSPPVTVQP